MTVAVNDQSVNIRHETPNKQRRQDAKSRQSSKSALKSMTGQSNTQAVSYKHNKGDVTDEGGAIYIEERDMSKITPGTSDFKDEQVR